MLLQRLAVCSSRRGLTKHSSRTLSAIIYNKIPLTVQIAQIRPSTTTTAPSPSSSSSSSASSSILVDQRRRRPISPHMTIYRPQLTWYLSGLNRITGSVLSGGFYAFGAAYLVAPLFGWHLESAAMAASFGALPWGVKTAIKATVALPFTFHAWNGIRHLVWDTGRALSNKQVVRTGWGVIGLTIVSSGVLAFI